MLLVTVLAPSGANAEDDPVTVLAPSGANAEDDLGKFMKSEKALYGTMWLTSVSELLIRYHFRNLSAGFYVDVGCNHYKINSTTYYLEEHRKWSGIGVDPLESLRADWEKHRPRSKIFSYAVTNKSGEMITFFAAGGLSATEIDTDNLEWWKQQLDFKPVEVTVPTITITDLLDREGVKKIDFLSIDINGAELVALEGFDIERFAPELVHVEMNHPEELKAYFAKHNYVPIDEYLKWETANWYFTPKK